MLDVFVRYIELPIRTEAVVCPNSDCTYDIYINSKLCKRKQKAALAHEIEHIKLNHLYSAEDVAINEEEAG